MTELEQIECRIYETLIEMYRSMTRRGPVARGMIELAYGLSRGELQAWVDEKTAMIREKIEAVQAKSGSTSAQGAERG